MHSLCANVYTICFTNIISSNPTTTRDKRKCCSIICLVRFLPLGQWCFPSLLYLGWAKLLILANWVRETIMPVTAWLEHLIASVWPWSIWLSPAAMKSATPVGHGRHMDWVASCPECHTCLLTHPVLAPFHSFLVFSLPYQCFPESLPKKFFLHSNPSCFGVYPLRNSQLNPSRLNLANPI